MESYREVGIVRGRGQITIPTSLRRAVGLEEGDPVEMVRTDEGILLRPKKLIDAEQAWFWTRGWQAGEREASEDLAAGRTRTFKDEKAFVASLAAETGSGYPSRRGKAGARKKARPSRRTP